MNNCLLSINLCMDGQHMWKEPWELKQTNVCKTAEQSLQVKREIEFSSRCLKGE